MKPVNILFPVFLLLLAQQFTSCTKSSGGGSGGATSPSSGLLLKTLTTIAIDPTSGSEADSIRSAYNYDAQDRSTSITKYTYDPTQGKIVEQDTTTYAYGKGVITLTNQLWTTGGGHTQTVTTYFLNTAGTLADSSTVNTNTFSAPATTTLQSYSYDGNGYLVQQNNYDLTNGQPVLNNRAISTITGGNTIMTVDTLVTLLSIGGGQSFQFYDTISYTFTGMTIASQAHTISDYIGSYGVLGHPNVNFVQSLLQLGIGITLVYTFDSQQRVSIVTDNLGGVQKYATNYYTYY